MPAAGWFPSNAHRAYPFQDAPLPVMPDEAVVDFGCMIGPGASFLPDEHSIYMESVTLSGSVLTFTFRSDCPGLANRTLVFTRATSGEDEFATEFSESDGGGCPGSALWDGYLVTGRLEALADAVLAASGELLVGQDTGTVEPAVNQVLSSLGVTGITLANREPERVPDDCASSSSIPSGRRTLVWATCLVGSVKLVEGYNSAFRVSVPDNSITIGAVKGGGAGEPCEDVSLRPGEPADARQKCSDVILTVNGLPVRRLQMVGGLGSHVVPGPGDNELTVLVDLRGISGSGE